MVKMKPYQRITLGVGAILYGLANIVGCGGKEGIIPTQEPVPQEGPVAKSDILSPYRLRLFDITGSKVGITSELGVFYLNNFGIENVTLFEDGNPIINLDDLSDSPFGFKTKIEKTEPSEHTYWFEVVYSDGKKERSEALTIEYSGKLEDRIPETSIWDFSKSPVQQKATLAFLAWDTGDGAGLERAVLYEDGIPFKQYGIDDFRDGEIFGIIVDIEKTQAGEHDYVFEVTDAADNTARSDTIKISFNP